MEQLEYLIGGVETYLESFGFGGADPYQAAHKFVVGLSENRVSIYIAQARRHKDVVERFNIQDPIVGGGSCYTNNENELVLGDYSGDFRAISKEAAEKFARLLLPDLRELGICVNGIIANPRESNLNGFWEDI